MNSNDTIIELLKRIGNEIGIHLSRQTDYDRIHRYLENGGSIPSPHQPIPSELINLITTNETYFERESHHFDFLLNTILPKIEITYSSRPIRILSAPCSSGEEPYNIALRILESSGRLSRPVEIIGVDISEKVIEKARAGIYSERSVHALTIPVLNKYFIRKNDHYTILPLNGISVRFMAGNLFDIALWKGLGEFDVIFSRNMMIYFTKEKNKELLELFKAHLKGYLIIGHADDHIQAKEMFPHIHTTQSNIYHL